MDNVTVLKITLEELSVNLDNPMNEGTNNPKIELKKNTIKNRKRSRVKFYRPDPYPIANGLLIVL
jgi:hypothetical protein